MRKVLFIQTSFIGDAILATSALETWHRQYPEDELHFLVRKGNESLFVGHPFLKQFHTWDKKQPKWRSIPGLSAQLRKQHFDVTIVFQRFLSGGLLALLSGAKVISGFSKNPLSFLFTHASAHVWGTGTHETERNLQVLKPFLPNGVAAAPPALYPSHKDQAYIKTFINAPYVCLAPASVWFTKQMPEKHWVSLAQSLKDNFQIVLLGAPGDHALCERIAKAAGTNGLINTAGKFSLLQSAAVLQGAAMNYVNDSAPMHLASAVGAPVTAIYCSTIPEFGFGPLSPVSFVVQATPAPPCKPCGMHGHRACPQEHFRCGEISVEALAEKAIKKGA